MATEELWVNGWGSERTAWEEVGTAPYLDAQDQPTHYVHSAVKKAEIGDFTFADTARPPTDTLNSVTLYVYSRKDGTPTSTFYLWDGTDWTDSTVVQNTSNVWGWASADVSSILDTWTKVDGAKLYIHHPNDIDQAEVDAAYLYIDYTAGSTTYESTFDIDVLLQEIGIEEPFDIDIRIQAIGEEELFDIDTRVQEIGIVETFDIDTTLQEVGIESKLDIDARVQDVAIEEAFDIDVLLRGWLGTWAKRMKITIDKDDIDSDLTHFPVLVYLSTSSGINSEDVTAVFDEVGSNSKKIAITETDGVTQLYVEIDKWDSSGEKAWLHVSKSGWVVSSTEDTTIYLYYDNTKDDNTTYVGDPNSVAAEAVWDSNFVFVSHMNDDPDASSIRDSTSNNNDGSKTSSGNPAVTTSGKMGDAQDFSTDEITLPTIDFKTLTNATIEGWYFDEDTDAAYGRSWQFTTGLDTANWINIDFGTPTTGLVRFIQYQTATNDIFSNSEMPNSTWVHVACLLGTGGMAMYVNGSVQTDTDATTESFNDLDTDTYYHNIGAIYYGGWYYTTNNIDEFRISSKRREAEWLKATHQTGIDHLLDYGSEELLSEYTTYTELFNIDVIVEKLGLPPFDIDTRIQKIGVESLFNIDTTIYTRLEEQFDIDTFLQVIGVESLFDIDTRLQVIGLESLFDIDTIVYKRLEEAFDIDTITLKTEESLFDIDTNLLATLQSLFDIDALVQEIGIESLFDIDLLVMKVGTESSFDIDVTVYQRVEAPFDIDTDLYIRVNTSFDIDTSVQVIGAESDFDIDVYLSQFFTEAFDIDVLVQKLAVESLFNIDTQVQEVDIQELFDIDTTLYKVTENPYDIDTLLKIIGVESDFNIDTLIQEVGIEKYFDIDILVQVVGSEEPFNIDILAQKIGIGSPFDIDTILFKINQETFDIDVYAQKIGIELPFDVDTTIFKLNTEPIDIDVFLQKIGLEVPFDIDLQTLARLETYFNIDTFLQSVGLEQLFDIDLLVQKLDNQLPFDIDSILFKLNEETFGIDIYVQRIGIENLFNIDTLLLKRTETGFDIDIVLTVPIVFYTIDFDIDTLLTTLVSKSFNIDIRTQKVGIGESFNIDVRVIRDYKRPLVGEASYSSPYGIVSILK